MPAVMTHVDSSIQQESVRAIIAYLASRTDQSFVRDVPDPESSERGFATFHEVGCVACHSPRDETGKEILSSQSVSLGDLAQKYSVASLTSFLEDPHAVRPSGRMPNLKLTHWEAVDLANYLISTGKPPKASKESSANAQTRAESDPNQEDLVRQGKAAYLAFGCAFCHEPEMERLEDRPFASLAKLDTSRGCLSKQSDRRIQYELNDTQKKQMVIALKAHTEALPAADGLIASMETLKCYQCHQRDGVGGVSIDRDPYFQSDDPNLGPQGRIPPTLSHVGAKLKPKWMRQVLVSGREIRPYVKTRMPVYGVPQVEPLIEGFQAVDQLPSKEWVNLDDPKEAKKVGTDLVGRDGFNCVACHTYQQKPAQTMQAVDLTEMGERLKRDWFEQYMRNPQSLSPGTVMPSFWPGGKSIRPEVLDGDTDQQVATVWLYLQDGRQARQPRGVVIEPMELLADREAVMLRRNYQGIGKRGIGVGYPGKVNIAFDAEQLRLAMIWPGEFADPGAAWRGQGSGTVRPLSRSVIRFPVGPDLDDVNNPWLVDEGRPPRHRFKGYRLDDRRRPTFRYLFDRVLVEDYLVDQVDGANGQAAALSRKIRLSSPDKKLGLRFRVAGSTQPIEAIGESTYRLKEGLRVTIRSERSARVIEEADKSELVIPLDLPAGVTELELDYQW